jgi:hypothetical protein
MRLTIPSTSLALSLLLALGGCQLVVDPDRPDGDDGDDPADGDEGDTDPSTDPCATVRCPDGTHCEVQEMQCITTPCELITACVPDEGDDEVTCASVLCREGTFCVETDEGPQCLEPDDNPCNDYGCPPDSVCELEDGEPLCVPVTSGIECGSVVCGDGEVCCNTSCGICAPPDSSCVQIVCEDGDPTLTCASILCLEGTLCVQTPEGAQCVPEEQNPCNSHECDDGEVCELRDGVTECVAGSSCADVLCGSGTYCDDISGMAECIPLPSCDDVDCLDSEECHLVDVQCVRAPCPPQPMCIPVGQDPCDGVECREGFHCEAFPIVCITEPCDERKAECVPDAIGAECGDSRCGPGTYCCNPSCGICAPLEGGCTEQLCGDD